MQLELMNLAVQALVAQAPWAVAIIAVLWVQNKAQARRDEMFAEALAKTGAACHAQSQDLDARYRENSEHIAKTLDANADRMAKSLDGNTVVLGEVRGVLLKMNGSRNR